MAICRWAAAPLIGGEELLHFARAAMPAGVLIPLLADSVRRFGVPVVLLVAGAIVVLGALAARALSKDRSAQGLPFEMSRAREGTSRDDLGPDLPPVVPGEDRDFR